MVSLTLTPMLCGQFLKGEEPDRQAGSSPLGLVNAASTQCTDFYERTLKWVLDHEYLMLVVTFAVIVATIWLYFVVPKGFFPQQDTGQMMGTTEAAQDISFEAMKESRMSW